MIPKVIHFCWFGNNEKSELIKKCIESWKLYCPDYEIIEWNEKNFDVNFCDYSKKAYELKKWAFVSDIARIKILYEHGGIYMDTDVELKRNLDEYLFFDAFFAQDDIRYINTGLGFGASKGNLLIEKLLKHRINREFDLTICNHIDTPIIRRYLNINLSKQSQCVNNIYIIGMDKCGKYIKHHETNSWKTKEERDFQNKRRYKNAKLKNILRNAYIINFLEKNGSTIVSKIYIFIAYDLLDNGIIYFVKRLINKIKKKNSL